MYKHIFLVIENILLLYYLMNIIQLIHNLLQNEKCLSNKYKIIINNECFSFFEGISIINCNNLTKDQYIINYSNNNINGNLNNILLINTLDKICNEKLDLPSTCQYVTAFIKRINYYHYFNKRYTETYQYNQLLIAEERNKDVKYSDNFIIIKCCHDSIRITKNKITFYERDTYDSIIRKLLPCLNYSSDQILIRFKPSIVSFTYPININFQLFDLMLYENALYSYIYTDENEDIIKNKEKLVYTINIFNQYFNNKDKVLSVIADKEECIKNNIPYVQWNNNYYKSLENSGYKIILSTNKNSTDNNFVFHDKKILFDSESESNLVPKCVKVIRKYKEKEKSVYFNIAYKLDKHCKGKFPSNLFISYGYELQGLYRQYFDIPEINNKFIICSKCNKFINILSQKELVNCVKEKFKNKQLKLINENYSYNDINILSFSVDNNMSIYPYCVFDYVYNCNSSFPFLIIMLNSFFGKISLVKKIHIVILNTYYMI
ncbi:hypothetical protein BCR36DRAFT_459264 [Piromyces finnis]|uniref:Uncharacterized protein n=1 Tax=Piromyces finnis TaxID=1754191 RepID=A0A1Y1UZ89_9FUNG|nr:hypothetical protein BCR36DRAFT_459264 [Piromyces finnis]|eukprot:ORX43936.1 hypothetical protein BCR36DRAFT_459264 [Piromyces finnis]